MPDARGRMQLPCQKVARPSRTIKRHGWSPAAVPAADAVSNPGKELGDGSSTGEESLAESRQNIPAAQTRED